MKRRGLLSSIALMIACIGNSTPQTAVAALVGNGQPDLVVSNADLALRFSRELVNEQLEANFFISPFSVFEVLEMLFNGAAGETEQQIKRFAGLDRKTFSFIVEEVEQSIQNRQQGVVVDLANSIWFDKTIRLNTNFTRRAFQAVAMEALDFGDPHSIEKVNDWTAERTHGRILKIVSEQLWAKSDLIVINAIFFQGDWESRFEKNQTKDESFKLEKGPKSRSQ